MILSKNMHLPTWSKVAVQREDSAPWTHDTIAEHSDEVQNDRSYKIRITKIGRLLIWAAKPVQPTPISAKPYLKRPDLKKMVTHICTEMTYTDVMNNTSSRHNGHMQTWTYVQRPRAKEQTQNSQGQERQIKLYQGKLY